MADSQGGGTNEKSVAAEIKEEANLYEDEINLMDYFLVPWKHKWFIFLASVLPALVVGLSMFLGPRDSKISYIYNMGLGEKDFKILEDKFYSTENLEKLVEELQANGLNDYAKKIAGTETAGGLRGLVSFEVSPLYFKTIEPSKAKDLDEFERFQQARGTLSLLIMHVTAQSKEHIQKIALVCRNNFEQVIPLYSEKDALNGKIVDLKEGMAGIEEARYMLNLQLERRKSTLEKLKNSGSKGLDKLPSDITLQFSNVGGNSAFLPLVYQIQAAETQIINLEEQIRANKEEYDYYTGLLKLNGKLFSHVEKSMASHYTLRQFHAFLTNTLDKYKEGEQQLQDYLKAYIKRIENQIASIIPLVEKPKVYPVAKGTAKKSATVFVIALMISGFVAFLREGLEKNKTKLS